MRARSRGARRRRGPRRRLSRRGAARSWPRTTVRRRRRRRRRDRATPSSAPPITFRRHGRHHAGRRVPLTPTRRCDSGSPATRSRGRSATALGKRAADTGVVAPVYESQVSSGLSSPGVLRLAQARRRAARGLDPEVVVFVMGTNDWTRPNPRPVDAAGEPAWKAKYRAQVQAMLDVLRAATAAPSTGSARRSCGTTARTAARSRSPRSRKSVVAQHPDAHVRRRARAVRRRRRRLHVDRCRESTARRCASAPATASTSHRKAASSLGDARLRAARQAVLAQGPGRPGTPQVVRRDEGHGHRAAAAVRRWRHPAGDAAADHPPPTAPPTAPPSTSPPLSGPAPPSRPTPSRALLRERSPSRGAAGGGP